jgi:hypothetical protein
VIKATRQLVVEVEAERVCMGYWGGFASRAECSYSNVSRLSDGSHKQRTPKKIDTAPRGRENRHWNPASRLGPTPGNLLGLTGTSHLEEQENALSYRPPAGTLLS